jgi:hypothetical protein
VLNGEDRASLHHEEEEKAKGYHPWGLLLLLVPYTINRSRASRASPSRKYRAARTHTAAPPSSHTPSPEPTNSVHDKPSAEVFSLVLSSALTRLSGLSASWPRIGLFAMDAEERSHPGCPNADENGLVDKSRHGRPGFKQCPACTLRPSWPCPKRAFPSGRLSRANPASRRSLRVWNTCKQAKPRKNHSEVPVRGHSSHRSPVPGIQVYRGKAEPYNLRLCRGDIISQWHVLGHASWHQGRTIVMNLFSFLGCRLIPWIEASAPPPSPRPFAKRNGRQWR